MEASPGNTFRPETQETDPYTGLVSGRRCVHHIFIDRIFGLREQFLLVFNIVYHLSIRLFRR